MHKNEVNHHRDIIVAFVI